MKVTDYIVEFIISKKVTDIFGYPGGVICHFIDSTSKYSDKLQTHINYHEQAAAFAACGYAQNTGKIGVAFSTSGPGVTNLVTGIANAYYDSIATIFLTGQVDTYGLKGNLPIRQKGFQETDVISMVRGITKYAVRVDNPQSIKYELEKAFFYATEGNPGPVVIDLPADVQRSEINEMELEGFSSEMPEYNLQELVGIIKKNLLKSERPCFLIGNGVKQAGQVEQIRQLVNEIEIPTVFSMPAFDILPYECPYNFGFIGANGHRYGNFVLGKSDLIISIGSRLDLKQVGNSRTDFAPQAKLIRIDIDDKAFRYPVHSNEVCLLADVRQLLPMLFKEMKNQYKCRAKWNQVCLMIKKELYGYDDETYTDLIRKFGKVIPNHSIITTDVGQNQVWIAQQLQIRDDQTVHMSTGHGAMGYALPAAIGAYYGKKRPVFCFNGDGGIQMNIQELQYLSREKIPVHVIVLNNHALGMIRGFQEANFDKNYTQTIEGYGYSSPNFEKIASAYDLQYVKISGEKDIALFTNVNINQPSLIEIEMPVNTSLSPNFGRNGLIQDQRPYLDRELYEKLMRL